MSDPAGVLRCATCGAARSAAAKFCRKCGAALDATDGAPADTTAPPTSSIVGSHRLVGSWGDLVAALRLFGALLAVVIVASAARSWADTPEPETDLATTVGIAVVVAAFAVHGRDLLAPLVRTSGFSRPPRWAAPLGYAVLVVFAEVYFSIGKWLGIPFVEYVAPFTSAGWPLWTVFALSSIAPAISEEIAFRGYVMAQLERSVGFREALLIQAALFSVLHLSPIVFPSHFVMGLVFGVLRRRTRSLYPGMFVHAAYNATVIAREVLESSP